MPVPSPLDRRRACTDHRRSSVTLQPSDRSAKRLERRVVGLERIVRMGLRAVEGRRERLIEDARVDRSVVTLASETESG